MHQPASRFTRPLVATAFLLLALSSGHAGAVCSCQCMAGEPRTLCTEFGEAAVAKDRCGIGSMRLSCAPGSVAPQAPQVPLEAPIEGAHHCHESALWDPATASYSVGVSVCETSRTRNSSPDS